MYIYIYIYISIYVYREIWIGRVTPRDPARINVRLAWPRERQRVLS